MVEWKQYIPGFVLVIILTISIVSAVLGVQPERQVFQRTNFTTTPEAIQEGTSIVRMMNKSNRNAIVTFPQQFQTEPAIAARYVAVDGRFAASKVSVSASAGTRTGCQIHVNTPDFPWSRPYDRQVPGTVGAMLLENHNMALVTSDGTTTVVWRASVDLSGTTLALPVSVGSVGTNVKDLTVTQSQNQYVVAVAADTSGINVFLSTDEQSWTNLGTLNASATGANTIDSTAYGSASVAVIAPLKPAFTRTLWLSADNGNTFGLAQTLNAGSDSSTEILSLSDTELFICYVTTSNQIQVFSGPAGALIDRGVLPGTNINFVSAFLDPVTGFPMLFLSDTSTDSVQLAQSVNRLGTSFTVSNLNISTGTSYTGLQSVVSNQDVFLILANTNGTQAALVDTVQKRACPLSRGPSSFLTAKVAHNINGAALLSTTANGLRYNFMPTSITVEWIASAPGGLE